MIINIWYYRALGKIISKTQENYIDYLTEKELYKNDFDNSRINLFIFKLANNLAEKISWLLFFPCLLFFAIGLIIYFLFSKTNVDNTASIIILCISCVFFLLVWSLPIYLNLWYVYKYKIYNLKKWYRITFIISIILLPCFLSTFILLFLIFDVMRKFEYTYKSG